MTTMLRKNPNATEEDLKKLETLISKVEYSTDAVKFLRLLHTAFEPMKDLLRSVNLSDVQAAVAFFVAAYQFDLDGAIAGALGKLRFV